MAIASISHSITYCFNFSKENSKYESLIVFTVCMYVEIYLFHFILQICILHFNSKAFNSLIMSH